MRVSHAGNPEPLAGNDRSVPFAGACSVIGFASGKAVMAAANLALIGVAAVFAILKAGARRASPHPYPFIGPTTSHDMTLCSPRR